MLPDIDAVTRILAETANEEILPRFRRLESHEIQRKESGELVTVADEAAEREIGRRLLELSPGSLLVGEEAVAKESALMDALAGEEPVWLIDPVDGTGNFAAGKPVFAVMVALVCEGRTLAAWIHDPIGARTAVAQAGAGAWLDGERLRVAAGGSLEELEGTLHSGQFATQEMARHIDSRRDRLNTVKSQHCAGQQYILLAGGQNHFSLFTKLMPWDHAPGVLIHGEAGGTGRTLDGEPYDPARRDAPALLLAPDETSWRALHEALFDESPFAQT